MHNSVGHRWTGLLGWLADRPVPAAVAATVLLAVAAALIRPPAIEGSMVDQLSGATEGLAVVRQIAAATGDPAIAAVIVAPGDASIATLFADLDRLRGMLGDLGNDVTLRSVDAASEQLFVYGLAPADPVAELLQALRGTPDAGAVISDDGGRFLLLIRSPRESREAVLDKLDEHVWPDAYTDITVLANAQLEREVAVGLGKDLRLLLPVIIAVTLVALFIAFGDWRALLLPLFTSVASTAVTFALFSVAVVTVNLITLLALPIVLIVGLANSCHFLAKSGAALESPQNIDAAVRRTLRRVGPPFFFSTVTTAIALASLSFNELSPIANLGLLSAGALLLVFPLVLLAAPLSLRWYLRGAGRSWQESPAFAGLSRFLAAGRMPVSSLLLLAMLAGAATLPLLQVKSEPRAFFPDAAPFSSALTLFEQEFYFSSPLQALVAAQNGEALAALRGAGELRELLAAQPGVKHVSIEPAVGKQDAFVVTALISDEERLTDISAAIDATSFDPGVTVVYTNAELVYGDIDRKAMDSLLRSLAWSVVLIFGAMLLVFRSVSVLLSAMLANAVPLMLVCGVAWLIGSPLNLVTVFVFLVALGVIVDDSIHILSWRAFGDRVSGSSIEFSVLLSTLVLCLGLMLCQLSDFPTTRQFAAYTALALVGAVISNLTILPLLLRNSPPAAGGE